MHRELQAVRLAIEELIQKWLAENPNERLPGTGQPLDLDEYFRWPQDLRLAYSLLKNSGHVPEEVELLREIGRLKAAPGGIKRRVEQKRIAGPYPGAGGSAQHQARTLPGRGRVCEWVGRAKISARRGWAIHAMLARAGFEPRRGCATSLLATVWKTIKPEAM